MDETIGTAGMEVAMDPTMTGITGGTGNMVMAKIAVGVTIVAGLATIGMVVYQVIADKKTRKLQDEVLENTIELQKKQKEAMEAEG